MDKLRVEVTRGGRTESVHAVTIAVADGMGRLAFVSGDVEVATYPRSAVKALLALPLVETGAADRLGLDEAALALACASHAGEAVHVETARAMLAAAGHDPAILACGTHPPLSRAAADALARAGEAPCPLHNNCSGKHAGLICLAVGLGAEPAGYETPDHPAMRAATAALAALSDAACDESNRATDGCGIPTYAIPLVSLARAFARFGTGEGLAPARARAASRLRRAVARHPDLLAGPGRFDTVLAAAFGERLFVKGGAEGVWCASLPEAGLGIAVKAEDGAGRAAEVALATLLERHLGAHEALASRARPVLRNWAGTEVGTMRVALRA